MTDADLTRRVDLDLLISNLRSEADIADRPGQYDRLRAMANRLVDLLHELMAERDALAAQLDGMRAGIEALAAEYDTFAGDVFPRVVTDLRALLGGDENEATSRHPEHYCHRCGGPNFPWWVPSPVWNAVMGYPDQAHDGIVCPRCFAELAEAKGAKGPWRVAPREWPEGVSLVHVDGRVWDAATELWVENEATT